MCVIIIKPAGVRMPAHNVIMAAATANPHGFGFVTDTDYYKTLDIDKFTARLETVTTDQPCIMHFRLATHGSIKRANCHPFKNHDVFMAHNGILAVRPDGDKTDSQTAFDRYIYPIIARHGYESFETSCIVESLIGDYSKIAMMYGGKILHFGKFIKETDGCLYSNRRFEHLLSPFERRHYRQYKIS